MSLVAAIDFISFLAVIVALIVLGRGWNRALPYDIKLLIVGVLGLALFNHFSNILEWGGISKALDPIEDFIEILTPMLWFMLIYSFLKELTTHDLQRSESRLIESQEVARLGQWELDLTSNKLYWSDGLYRIFDINPDEFGASYEAFLDTVHPGDREFVDNTYTDSVKNKTPYSIVHRLLLKDGTVKYVNEICHTEYDKGGHPSRSIGTIQDITDLKCTEMELAESELKYRSMMEAMKDPVYICSPDFRVEYMNTSMIKRTGHDATGEHCFKALHDLDEKCSWCTHHVIQQLKHLDIDIVSPKDNRSYHVSQSPIVHEDGSISKMTIFRDTTDLKKMEAQLQQAQKMEAIGTLAGGIAHDFNNILGAILGYAQLAGMDLSENSKSHRHIEQILKASDRAKSLVGQILAFSRENKPEKFPVDIGIIVKEALKLLRASLPANIEIRQNVTSNLGTVMADQTQVHQIMMNLCTNALHAMERNGGLLEVVLVPVELKEEDAAAYPDIKPDRYLKLSVTDSGHGMDSATVSRIFDPYFTTKDIDEGTGLGLATVHGIVKDHGGIIKVYSEPGSGTSFQIYLPCIEDNVITEEKVSKPLSTGTEQILFLDDDKVLADIGEKMLKKLGYRVNSRTSPYEALEAFKANPSKYDMVITDMTMPGMTGDILAKEILKIRYNIPIIICTGFSKMMSPEKASKMGIKDFLMKPFTMSDLSKSIRTVLDQN